MLTWEQLPEGPRWRRVTRYLESGRFTWAVGWPGVALAGEASSAGEAQEAIRQALTRYGRERMWRRN